MEKKYTARFVNAVTQLRNCLNIKANDGWVLLSDKNREPISSTDDPRFEKMLKLAEQFKDMNVSENPHSGCICALRPISPMS